MVVLLSDAKEVINAIKGDEDWKIFPKFWIFVGLLSHFLMLNFVLVREGDFVWSRSFHWKWTVCSFVFLFFLLFNDIYFFLSTYKKKEECVFVRQDFVIERKKFLFFFFAAVLFSYFVRHIFLTEK